jgi:WD40 repeat protein
LAEVTGHAALGFAVGETAGAATAAVVLAEGVLRAMYTNRLKCGAVIGVLVLACGLAAGGLVHALTPAPSDDTAGLSGTQGDDRQPGQNKNDPKPVEPGPADGPPPPDALLLGSDWHPGRTLPVGQGGHVWTATLLPDSDRLVVGGYVRDGENAPRQGVLWLLDLKTGAVLRTWKPPDSTILTGLTAAADGKRVAVVSAFDVPYAHELHLWDPATGEARRLVGKHDKTQVFTLAFAPDGGTLAVYTHNPNTGAQLHLWDVNIGEARRLFARPQDALPINSLAFTPDGRTLVLGTSHLVKNLHAWDVATGEPAGTFGGLEFVHNVAFAPDGRTLAAFGPSGLRLYDWLGRAERPGFQPAAKVNLVESQLVFAPDGQTLAAAAVTEVNKERAVAVHLFETATGRLQRTLHQQLPLMEDRGRVRLAFSPGGKAVLLARLVGETGWAGVVTLWEAATGRELAALRHPEGECWAGVTPRGDTLVTAGAVVRLWEARAPQPRPRRTLWLPPGLNDLVLSADGKTLATMNGHSAIALWDGATGGLRKRIDPDHLRFALSLSPDGTKLAAAGGTYGLGVRSLWDAGTGRAEWRKEEAAETYHAVAFAPDGRTVAVSDFRGISLLDAQTGQVRQRWREVVEHVNALAYTPDGGTLVGAAEKGVVWLWDAETGQVRRKWTAHAPGVGKLALGRGGKLLATVNWTGGAKPVPGEVKIWELESGKLLRALELPGVGVKALTFSPDGKTLAVAGAEAVGGVGVLKFWDVGTGQWVRTVRRPAGPVVGVAFTADNRTAVLGGGEGTVEVWACATLMSASEGPQPTP